MNRILLIALVCFATFSACKSHKSAQSSAQKVKAPAANITLSAATVSRTFPGISTGSITDDYRVLWSLDVATDVIVDSFVMEGYSESQLSAIINRKFFKGQFSVEKDQLVQSSLGRIVDRANDHKGTDSLTAYLYISLPLLDNEQLKLEIPGFDRQQDVFAP